MALDEEINLYDDDDEMIDVQGNPEDVVGLDEQNVAVVGDASGADGTATDEAGDALNKLASNPSEEDMAMSNETVYTPEAINVTAYSIHGGLETCALQVSDMTWVRRCMRSQV